MVMLDPSKITVIRSYLESEFADLPVFDSCDLDHEAQSFRVGQGVPSYLATVTAEFISDHSAEEIVSLIGKWQLGQVLRRVGRSRVRVTNSGLRIEDQ